VAGGAKWIPPFDHCEYTGPGQEVTACWLYPSCRPVHWLHLPASGLRIVTPVGGRYKDSLGARQRFVPTEGVAGERKFLRNEPGAVDAYLDLATGDEVFMSRVRATGGDPEAGAGTEASGDTGALGDDGPVEPMTDEYVQTAVLAIGAPDLTPEERDKLRTLLVAARSHDKLGRTTEPQGSAERQRGQRFKRFAQRQLARSRVLGTLKSKDPPR